jgi:hypothetical protein
VNFADGRLKLMSQHRIEMNSLETEIDADHAKELIKLRNDISEQATMGLKDAETQLTGKLKDKGRWRTRRRSSPGNSRIRVGGGRRDPTHRETQG